MIKERYAGLGLKRNGSTAAEMTTQVKDQLARYGKAIRDNNISAD